LELAEAEMDNCLQSQSLTTFRTALDGQIHSIEYRLQEKTLAA
jgi:hypothetical protein